MTEKFKDIMTKKKKACAKRNGLGEEKKVKRPSVFVKIHAKEED